MKVKSLGYVRLETNDLDGWRRFGADVLGLMPVDDGKPDSVAFRMDDRAYRIVVTEGDKSDLTTIGFDAGTSTDLDAIVGRLVANGVDVTEVPLAEALEHRVQRLYRCSDPAGLTIELFSGAVLPNEPLVTPVAGGFVTGDMGMGHVGIDATDFDASLHFYVDLLGIDERNTFRFGPGEPPSLQVKFLGSGPRHHTVALASVPWSRHLVHLMVEVGTIDDIGYMLDRCKAHDIEVVQTLGRHTNDHMLSVYVKAPDGAMVEYGCQGLRVDPDTWVPDEITKGAFWGHHVVGNMG